MSDFHDIARNGLSAQQLEAALRRVGAERYHNRHPHHHQMTAGALSKDQLRAWALNRYCYQAVIPRKDAMILARAEDPAFRAAWRKRATGPDDLVVRQSRRASSWSWRRWAERRR